MKLDLNDESRYFPYPAAPAGPNRVVRKPSTKNRVRRLLRAKSTILLLVWLLMLEWKIGLFWWSLLIKIEKRTLFEV